MTGRSMALLALAACGPTTNHPHSRPAATTDTGTAAEADTGCPSPPESAIQSPIAEILGTGWPDASCDEAYVDGVVGDFQQRPETLAVHWEVWHEGATEPELVAGLASPDGTIHVLLQVTSGSPVSVDLVVEDADGNVARDTWTQVTGSDCS